MKYLVDANVLSETTKERPDRRVVAWLTEHERHLAVDPIILGELEFGILLLPKGRRRAVLEAWFDNGVRKLNCIPWDAETGSRWAALLAQLRARGHAMPIKDSLIAATALQHNLHVATRDVSGFRRAGVRVVNPFA